MCVGWPAIAEQLSVQVPIKRIQGRSTWVKMPAISRRSPLTTIHILLVSNLQRVVLIGRKDCKAAACLACEYEKDLMRRGNHRVDVWLSGDVDIAIIEGVWASKILGGRSLLKISCIYSAVVIITTDMYIIVSIKVIFLYSTVSCNICLKPAPFLRASPSTHCTKKRSWFKA